MLGTLCNLVLPWAAYRLSRPHFGETRAIVISAGVPALWSVAQFARTRKIDVVSALVLGGLALSLAAIALGASPKLLLLRGSLVTGLGGLVLIVSAAVRRPLMYAVLMPMLRAAFGRDSALTTMLPNRVAGRAVAAWENLEGEPWFARLMAAMTWTYGLIFVAEAALLTALVFSLSTERALLLFPIVRYATAAVLMAWMFLVFIPAVRRNQHDDDDDDA